MLDLGWSEMLVIAVVAIVVIGPKDLPGALRAVGRWMAKARAAAREFQSGIDQMVADAELDELRKTANSVRNMDADSLLDKMDPTGSTPAGSTAEGRDGESAEATTDQATQADEVTAHIDAAETAAADNPYESPREGTIAPPHSLTAAGRYAEYVPPSEGDDAAAPAASEDAGQEVAEPPRKAGGA